MYSIMKIEFNLAVPSIEETVAWYEDVLGWAGHYDVFDTAGRCTFGSVMRGEKEGQGFNLIRVSEKKEPYTNENANFNAFIAVDNVDALYAQVIEKGATPHSEPKDQLWGGRTFTMQDVNGFILMFYQLVEDVTVEEIRRRHEQTLRQDE